MSLRSILGVGRVKKRKAPNSKPRASPASTTSSSSRPSSLPTPTKASAGQRRAKPRDEDEEDQDYFHDKLDDYGLVKALASDLNLRDVVLSHAIHPKPHV